MHVSVPSQDLPPKETYFPISAVHTSGRQRTAQACDKCRERKTKCSGDKPICQRCTNRGLICEYSCREPRVRGPARARMLASPTIPSVIDSSSPIKSVSSTASGLYPRHREYEYYQPRSMRRNIHPTLDYVGNGYPTNSGKSRRLLHDPNSLYLGTGSRSFSEPQTVTHYPHWDSPTEIRHPHPSMNRNYSSATHAGTGFQGVEMSMSSLSSMRGGNGGTTSSSDPNQTHSGCEPYPTLHSGLPPLRILQDHDHLTLGSTMSNSISGLLLGTRENRNRNQRSSVANGGPGGGDIQFEYDGHTSQRISSASEGNINTNMEYRSSSNPNSNSNSNSNSNTNPMSGTNPTTNSSLSSSTTSSFYSPTDSSLSLNNLNYSYGNNESGNTNTNTHHINSGSVSNTNNSNDNNSNINTNPNAVNVNTNATTNTKERISFRDDWQCMNGGSGLGLGLGSGLLSSSGYNGVVNGDNLFSMVNE